MPTNYVFAECLTPNRSDCLGLKGIAREVGVLYREDVSPVEIPPVAATSSATFSVELVATNKCARYFGRVIEGVDASAASPQWMQEKLRRSDVRPIDAIVDITNYVLLELGQPMHAFDLDKLKSGIVVRNAEKGESITLFLEAAFFDPIAIAGKARDYGLHTDSSHRFERGVDYELAKTAIERATQLILEIAEVEEILTRLGLSLLSTEKDGWLFDVPSYRFDLAIEADLLEELARIYGYNNLPTTTNMIPQRLPTKSETQVGREELAAQLVARDYRV